MKMILFLFLALSSSVYAGTCTSISRTNSSALSVLTSTKYNNDLNTSYSALNAFDGGCVTSGTLEFDSLNTTQFSPVLKGVKEGCKVSYSNASTVSIGKCLAAVNGTYVYTTVATTASFGCTGCSAEVASTTYYVYIQTGSSATTLTPLILTTTPNEDGYDNSGNKILAKFYNNGSSNIDQYSIKQWKVNGFEAPNAINTPGVENIKRCYAAYGGSTATLTAPVVCSTGTCVEVYDSCSAFTPPAFSATGTYTNFTVANGTFAASSLVSCTCNAYDAATNNVRRCATYWETGDQSWSSSESGGYVGNVNTTNPGGTGVNTYFIITCEGADP